MRGKLRFLDLGLLVFAGLLYWHLRGEWIDSHARDLALLNSTLPATKCCRVWRLSTRWAPSARPTLPMSRIKTLFSKDRNPQVIVDPPPPAPVKPQPPFPVAHGVMIWDGVPPTIVLSEKAGGPQRGYRPGDTIGPWTIVSVDNSYADFEWDGKEFKKRIDELIDRTPIAQAAPPPNAVVPAAQVAAAAKTLSNLAHWSRPGRGGRVQGLQLR